MIDTVLKEVREAEEKAELMQKQAYQRGKDIVLKAEAEAEAQKKINREGMQGGEIIRTCGGAQARVGARSVHSRQRRGGRKLSCG